MAVLAMTPEVRELRERARELMDRLVYPNEALLDREDDEAEALVKELRAEVRAAGLWAPHIGPEAGGSGRGFVAYAFLNELIGRSAWAPLVFGCQAPDAGNAEILHLFGTPDQRERWLRPLVAGDVRSFFSMTEPEVSGSDPTGLRTTAVRDGDDWVIDGHKWFSSGAEGAAFGIVMAVTDPGAEPHRRMSQIIVPATTPGVELVRAIPVMGHRGRGWSTHCEVRYHGVRVPVANTIGEPGDGFRIAQKRLGPGRIHHVMRWLGQMQRAFELMCGYALGRQAFGGPLAGKQTVQNWVADSAAEIQACRLLTLDAAARIDQGDEARVEISAVKFYAARVLHDVIDRAVQTHGALGLTDQTPLARMYADARAARFYDGPDEVHRMVVSRRVLRAFEQGGVWDFADGGPRQAGAPGPAGAPVIWYDTPGGGGKPCLQSRTTTATASSPRCAATCPTSTSAARTTAASPGSGRGGDGSPGRGCWSPSCSWPCPWAAASPSAAAATPAPTAPRRSPAPPRPAPASPTASPECAEAVERANQSISHAVRLSAALREHTAIMNDLLNGKISADEALRTGTPSLIAGSAESAKFDVALADYRKVVDRCQLRSS